MAASEGHHHRSFFVASHRARLLLIVLLAIVFAGTSTSAFLQMVRPVASVTATIREVNEIRQGNLAVSYTLVLGEDGGQSGPLRLRNNGRVLAFLLSQESLGDRRFTILHSRGEVVALTPLDGVASTIRETLTHPAVKILIALLALLILVFHLGPAQIERAVIPPSPSLDDV